MTTEDKSKVQDQDTGDKNAETGEESKPAPHIARRSFDSAFSTPEQQNNIRYLVETGDNPRDLFMRSVIPSKLTDAYALLIATETELKKCIKYGDKDGEENVRNRLAMLPSLDGEGRKQLVQAFIGGTYGDQDGNGDGLTNKLKRIAFGSNGRQ